LGVGQRSGRFAPEGSLERFGPYDIIKPLASGGMATTYLARPAGAPAGQEMVVKRILAELRDDPELRALFGAEVGVAQQLDHPNIVKAMSPLEVSGELVLPLEFVWGEDLRALAERALVTGRPLRATEVVFIIAEAARGLHHFHTRRSAGGQLLGLVHRDVSPPNLMVDYTGRVKVLDFGIARAEAAFMEVRPGQLPGKFGYMSPEQVDGLEVTAASDQFALGVVLYELTMMRRLFKADSDMATMRLVSRANIAVPTSLVPGFSPALSAIMMQALARDPRDRFEDCAALAAALDTLDLGEARCDEAQLGEVIRGLFSDHIAETRALLGANYAGPLPLDAPERRQRFAAGGPSPLLVGEADRLSGELDAEVADHTLRVRTVASGLRGETGGTSRGWRTVALAAGLCLLLWLLLRAFGG
jgi:serine/threonine-protein kinase